MSIFNVITSLFANQQALLNNNSDALIPLLAEATELIQETLISGNKLISSASEELEQCAKQLSSMLINPEIIERPPLPCFYLAQHIASSEGTQFSLYYQEQLKMVLKEGDTLVLFIGTRHAKSCYDWVNSSAFISDNVILFAAESSHLNWQNILPRNSVLIEYKIHNEYEEKIFCSIFSSMLAELIEKRIFNTMD